MTPEQTWRAHVETCILFLAAECDGAQTQDARGFDGRDTGLGKSFAEQITRNQRPGGRPEGDRLSPRQFPIAERMVHKYRGQLQRGGLNPEKPTAAAPPAVAPKTIPAPVPAPVVKRCPCGEPALDDLDRCADCILNDLVTQPLAAPPKPVPPEQRPQPVLRDRVHVPTVGGPTVDELVAAVKAHHPAYEERPQQMAFMHLDEQVLRGHTRRPHLVAELATGTGKSQGLILPFLAASATTGRRMIIVTQTKALQMQYRGDAEFLMGALQEVRPFTMAEMKGRRNYLCLKLFDEKVQERAQTGQVTFRTPGAAAQFPALRAWERETATGDIEDLPFEPDPALKSEVTTDRRGCADKKCPFYRECYVTRAQEHAAEADITVLNTRLFGEHIRILQETDGYAGVIKVGTRPSKGEPSTPANQVPIIGIDEAHGLEDVMREVLGIEISFLRFRYVIDRAAHYTWEHKEIATARKLLRQLELPAPKPRRGKPAVEEPDAASQERARAKAQALVDSADRWAVVIQKLQRVAQETMAAFVESMQGKETRRLGDEMPLAAGLLAEAVAFSKYAEDQAPSWLDEHEHEMWRKLVDQTISLREDLEHLLQPNDPDHVVRFAELTKPEEGSDRQPYVTLKCQPIDVAPQLTELLWDVFPHITAVSATIAGPTGLDFWRERVGAGATEEMVVGAPFDFQKNALTYLPADGESVNPKGAARSLQTLEGRRYLQASLDQVEALVRASQGGAFVLFTSGNALRAAYQGVAAQTITRYPVDGQAVEVALPAVAGLADRLERDYPLYRQGQMPRKLLTEAFKAHGSAVLLGLKTYWEGVDVPGEALRLVIVHQFPFSPPDDPVWEALCSYITKRGGSWFRELALPTATIAIKQGVGRLIRRQTDYGVMVVLDGRATTAAYGDKIMACLPPAPVTRSLDAVAAFYAARRPDSQPTPPDAATARPGANRGTRRSR